MADPKSPVEEKVEEIMDKPMEEVSPEAGTQAETDLSGAWAKYDKRPAVNTTVGAVLPNRPDLSSANASWEENRKAAILAGKIDQASVVKNPAEGTTKPQEGVTFVTRPKSRAGGRV